MPGGASLRRMHSLASIYPPSGVGLTFDPRFTSKRPTSNRSLKYVAPLTALVVGVRPSARKPRGEFMRSARNVRMISTRWPNE